MSVETCSVCGRRAQRLCQAIPGPICSQCCGRGRRRTIECPNECRYFRAGVEQSIRKLAELSGDPEFEWKWGEVLHNLRFALARVRNTRLRDLTDEEAGRAFANVADTMRTRSSGLVYDFKSPDPRIQMASDELLSVAGMHEKGEKGMLKADAAGLMACLRYLERQAKAAAGQDRGPAHFLDLAAQAVGSVFAAHRPDWQVGP
jgi:hypothetical protein